MTSRCSLALALMASPILAQTQRASAASPQFEVASIRPANPSERPGRMGAQIGTSPGLLVTRSANLNELIAAAYTLESYQVSGGAAWVESARFAVEAKAASAAPREQLMAMLRPLLADRFALAFHRETRELAVYALVVAKNGPKFGSLKTGEESARGKLNRLGRNVDMAWFARYLSRFGADKPVIDKTGLTGKFDLNLDMDRILTPLSESGDPSIGSMFEATANAIRDQLGLKLAATKAVVEMLVIDRAEKLAGN